MLRGLTLLALLALLPGAVSAQSIRGTVTDVTTRRPVVSMLIVAVGPEGSLRSATTTDHDGTFTLRVPRGDSVRLRVHGLGYRVLESVPVALGRSDVLRLEIGVHPVPIEIEGVTAVAPNANLERFLQRQQSSSGRFVGPDQIAALAPATTSALLWGVAGSILSPSFSGRRVVAKGRDAESAPGLPRGACVPTVYVDGFELDDDSEARAAARQGQAPGFVPPVERGVPIDAYVPARVLRAVEVYQSPLDAPNEFRRPFMPDCAVVVVWTSYAFDEKR